MLKTEEEQEVEIRYVHKDVDLANFPQKPQRFPMRSKSQPQTTLVSYGGEFS